MFKGKSIGSIVSLGGGIAAIVLVGYLYATGLFEQGGMQADTARGVTDDPADRRDTGGAAGGAGRAASAGDEAAVGPPSPFEFPTYGAPASVESGPLRYDTEYPTVDYSGTPLTGRLANLDRQLAAGELTLDSTNELAFLGDLLAALEIDPSSQTLVFSKTSLQVNEVAPGTPRAIYFNDDTYVAYVRNAASFEIASIDPVLGPVYHTISRAGARAGELVRETNRCLRCHDSLSLTGGGVPRLLTGSGYIGTEGELVSHEAWILMRPWTPLRSRWGGWYVTGSHGDQVHLGNIVVEDIADLDDLESLRVGNIETVDGLIDTSPYLTPYSDIVALLVMQHQIQVQNDITELNWDLLTDTGVSWPELEVRLESMPTEEVDALIFEHGEPLIETLVMAFDVELTAPVAGTSGFARWFESLGARDPAGRSLRDLDLERHVFRYPLSYLVHSAAFDAMPVQARRWIYRRIAEELTGNGRLELEGVYPAETRRAALDIMAATKPEAAAVLGTGTAERQ